MATSAEQAFKRAGQVDRELRSQLQKSDPLFADIEALITQLRTACEAIIFLDVNFAAQEHVESRLWDAHGEINKRYRKLTDHFDNRQVVEKRKVLKHYADFIKTSQFFYKGYIQRLASHFASLDKLRTIAHRLSLSQLTVDKRIKVTPEIKDLIEKSCYDTLLHLGDLSRYRNNMRTKDRSWEPALGYYKLAEALNPDNGHAHNQIAVISVHDEDHLNAIYYLYRAIATLQPHPLARKNLEHEFKVVTTSYQRLQNSAESREGKLTLLFMRLHAEFYKGASYGRSHEEIENTVLNRIPVLLKEQAFEDTLSQYVLVNIAAQYLALEKVNETLPASTESLNSYIYFMRFNIRLFHMLLEMLGSELQQQDFGQTSSDDQRRALKAHEQITPLMRRILPALRQYTAWLVYHGRVVAQIDKTAEAENTGKLSNYITDMWEGFAKTLTTLATAFSVTDLKSAEYMMPEDEPTIGFKPLYHPDSASAYNLYVNEHGVLKPRTTDPGVRRIHPNMEMLSRVRDMLLGALSLHIDEKCPIAFSPMGQVFLYTETDRISPLASDDPAPTPVSTRPGTASSKSKARPSGKLAPMRAGSNTSKVSADSDMYRMVDSLLENSTALPANETSYGMNNTTANEVFNHLPIGSRAKQCTPRSIIGSLPGIVSSPFTPQPDELQGSPHGNPGSRHNSPLQFTTSQQRSNAAAALDNMTGYSPQSGPWNSNPRGSRPVSTAASQQVNTALQESLAKEYMPMSFGFSDMSSMYGGTPARLPVQAFRNGNGNGNNTTMYSGASTLDRAIMMQSSLGKPSQNSQPPWGHGTPPGGQGG